MENKHILFTFFISLFLFLLVVFLIYVIYCFSYFDSNQEDKLFKSFNTGSYDFVYDNLENNKEIDKDLYNYNVNLNFNNKTLKEVHDKYYSDQNLDEFLNKYLFSNRVEEKDVHYSYEGKTTLTKRRVIKYKSINIKTDSLKSSFGVMKNVSFNVLDDSLLIIDEQNCSIKDRVCHFDYILGGLHTLVYEHDNIKYFALVNVIGDNTSIDVVNEDSLVKFSEVKGETKTEEIKQIDLKYGKYKINKCFLSSDCANKKKSFLILNEDGSANLFLWFNLAQAGDSYFGTYRIENNFLILDFPSHTYKEFDYDTKKTTVIDIDVKSEFRYKMENDHIIVNDDYRFIFNE